MVYSLSVLNDYIERGLLIKQVHPTLPLSIYNYSQTCQYEKLWDEITLNCRGLVLDNEGKVVAKCFPKFFNMEEHNESEIPNESFDVYMKLDGSFGLCFYYAGKWHIATRGSFASEQAIRATEMLSEIDTDKFDKKLTYLFEIIYNENVIVCRYDFEGLVLLGAYETETGLEVDFEYLRESVSTIEGLRVVTKYDAVSDYKALKTMISDDEEGYVIRFKNGMRMKIKGEEYVRLHRILTNLSTTVIWEHLRDGLSFDTMLDNIPDEFYASIKLLKEDLTAKFNDIENKSKFIYEGIKDLGRKEFAVKVVLEHKDLSAILFCLRDGKSYDKKIWNMIKPEYSPLKF